MKEGLSTARKGISFILLLSLIFIIQGCGGGGGGSNSDGSSSSSSAQALIGLTDAPGDFVRYAVNVTAIKLYKKDGTFVDALPTTGTTMVDFAQLTNMTEFLTSGTVGVGTYDKVIMTLDYSNADIEVYDNNGNVIPIPVANITDENGTAITSTIDLTVDLDSNLTVAVGGPVHMALDFNLGSTNVVTFSGDTPSLAVSPVLNASLKPDTDKIQRFRGPLQSVNVSGNSFVMILRPFANALSHDTSFGTMTVNVDSNTAINIDGVTYTTAGLQALAAKPAYTAVIAHGTFDSSLNFTAKEVLAGSSVPGGTLDAASGTVLSRSGDTLTIKGATLTRSTGTVTFNPTMTVTLASTTKVSKQFSKNNFTINDISVGQHIGVLGTYNSSTTTLDATSGYARMYITTILGKLNYPASSTEQSSGWLSMSLQRIDGIKIVDATTPFNFAGTGTNSSNDATILDYAIEPAAGLDTSALITNHMPLRMKGFMAPFGAAPEDFDAQTIMNLSDAKAFLNVGWGAGRLESVVFTSTPTTSTGLILNGSTIGNVGKLHRVNRGNDITDFVLDYPGIDPIVQADGASTDKFSINQGGVSTVYDTYANFINALNTACTAGAKIKHLNGWGTFNDASVTFSASSLQVILN